MTSLKLFSTLFLLFLFTILFGYPSIIKLLHDDTILVEDTGNYLSEGRHKNIADFETLVKYVWGVNKSNWKNRCNWDQEFMGGRGWKYFLNSQLKNRFFSHFLIAFIYASLIFAKIRIIPFNARVWFTKIQLGQKLSLMSCIFKFTSSGKPQL